VLGLAKKFLSPSIRQTRICFANITIYNAKQLRQRQKKFANKIFFASFANLAVHRPSTGYIAVSFLHMAGAALTCVNK